MNGWFSLFLLFFHPFHCQCGLNCSKLQEGFDGNKHKERIQEIATDCAHVDFIRTRGIFVLTGKYEEEKAIFANKSRIQARGFGIKDSFYKSFRIAGPQQRLTIKTNFFDVSDNEYLNSLQLPNLKYITVGHLLIINNTMLTNITFPENANINVQMDYYVTGNRRLGRRWINLLKKSLTGKGRGHIQDYGECYFPGELEDVAHLEGCNHVFGDLVFAPDAIQSPTYSDIHLSKIIGCLDIRNTRLTSLKFLRNTVISKCDRSNVIDNNPLVCDEDKLTNITGDLSNNCHFVCRNLSELMTKKTCHTLNFDLIVDNNTDPLLLEQLKRIKRINGIVKVIGTDLNKIDFLESLWFIVSTKPGPALIIRNNLNLKELILNHLTDSPYLPGLVVAPTTLKVYVKHNGEFKMPKEQFKKFQQILIDPNSIEADVDMKPPKDIYSDEGNDENDSDFDFHPPVKEENNTLNPTRTTYFITVSTLFAVAFLIIAEGISVLIKYVTHKFKQQVVSMDGPVAKTPVAEPMPRSVTASDRSFYDTPNEESKSSVKPPTDSDNSNVTSKNSKPSPQSSDVSTQLGSSHNPSSQNQSQQQK